MKPELLAAAAVAASLASAPLRADMIDGEPMPTPKFQSLQPGQRPLASTDEGGVWLIAEDVERRIKTSGTVVTDAAVNGYVRGIVCKLAGPYCGDIRVYVVRHADFNASMMANGAMVVWTGLLLRAANDAQLAAVLGHEIGHYVRRHSIQMQRDLRDKAGANMILGSLLGAAGIPAGPLLAVGFIGSIYAYSRENEREADAVGAQLMADAGYDVREAATLWQNVIAEGKDDESEKSRSWFFASHPDPGEREATLARLAAELNRPDATIGKGELRALVTPHRLTYLRDEMNLRRYTKFGNLLARLEKGEMDNGEIAFMRGEMYRLRAGEGDVTKAAEAYHAAAAFPGAPRDLYRSLGMVQARLGDNAAARAAYARYLELTPDAEDRELVQMMLKQVE